MLDQQKVEWKKILIQNMGSAMKQVESVLDSSSNLYNRLILLKSRYTTATLEFDQGVVKDTDHRLVINQLTRSLINLIDDIEQEDLKSTKSDQEYSEILGLFGTASLSISRDIRNYKWDEASPSFIETFDGREAALISFENYEEPIWSARHIDGVYKLVNDADEYAVKYHYLNIDNRDMALVPMSVDVKLEANKRYPGQSAGLIFCFDEISRQYYSFTVNNDKEYKLWVKINNAYRPLVSGRTSMIQAGDFNRLAVIKQEHHIYLFINDSFLKVVSDKSLASGDSGIIAMGGGSFVFDNLSFY